MVEIDCKGIACPGPVLKTKNAVEAQAPSVIRVRVDNNAAKENVSRFLSTQGYDINIETNGEDIIVIGKKAGISNKESDTRFTEDKYKTRKKTVVMITSSTIGHGDDKLGSSLMQNFLKTLKEIAPSIWKIILLNNGVRLTTSSSEALPSLLELQKMGVEILVCGTCLSFYNLLDQKQVGETTNMLDVVTTLDVADKVIHIN